ncbi:hypothetical protein VTK56DRAFT_6397 [Thermocarpiscus australiensis]
MYRIQHNNQCTISMYNTRLWRLTALTAAPTDFHWQTGLHYRKWYASRSGFVRKGREGKRIPLRIDRLATGAACHYDGHNRHSRDRSVYGQPPEVPWHHQVPPFAPYLPLTTLRLTASLPDHQFTLRCSLGASNPSDPTQATPGSFTRVSKQRHTMLQGRAA